MKKSIILSCLAAAFLASCSNEEPAAPQNQKEIAFSVATDKSSRAPIEGVAFADGQKIFVSAYNSISGKYFEGAEFAKADNVWKGGKYWPVNGTTSFLAYAVTDDFAATAKWGDNFADKVEFDLKDGFYKAGTEGTTATPYADLLYANGEQTKEKDYTTVPMTFNHAGAWVVFNVKLASGFANDEKVTVNSFELAKLYKGGKFTVDNSSYALKAAWDFKDVTAADYGVESFTAKDLSTAAYTFGAIIPEQNQTAIKFNYTLSGAGLEPQTVDFEYPLSRFNKWEMGKKYVYNITISFKEITITPEVTDWAESSTKIDF